MNENMNTNAEISTKLRTIEITTTIRDGQIISNLMDFKPLFVQAAESYRNVVYSDNVEEQIRQMKEDRKTLNKIKESLDERRKTVKKEYLIPLEAFEGQVKELIALIDEPCKEIDEGCKKLERERKEQKKAQIRAFYDTEAVVIEDEAYREELFNLIYNPSWENVTSTQKAYKETIVGKIKDYVEGMAALETMDENFREEGIREFKRSINLTEAVSLMNRLKKQQEELLEKERIRLQQEAEREAQRKLEEEKRKIREEEQRKARLEIEAQRKAEEEKRAVERAAAEAEAVKREKERQAELEEQKAKLASLAAMASKTNSTSVTVPTSNSNSDKIFIRVVGGTITEIFANMENVAVTVLDEDVASEKEILEFEKKIQGCKIIEF